MNMKAITSTSLAIILTLSGYSTSARADTTAGAPLDSAITTIQNKWDVVKFSTTDKDAQLKTLAEIEGDADTLSKSYPQNAEPLIWEGIAYATEAGVRGGMGALPKVDKAKALFEKAMTLNKQALNGGAVISLGSLYYQVPGWPISFGNNKKAESLLREALQISPNDIDANFYYGDYLVSIGNYKDAIPVLEHAKNAPLRPGRDVADIGRRKEIEQDLSKAMKHEKQNN